MAHQNLGFLPIEILDLTFGNEDFSYLLVTLWKCGDSQLNAKLARGITFLSLTSFWSEQVGLPKMLLQLGALRTLKLKSPGDFEKSTSQLVSLVKSLPKTLQTLELDGRQASLALLNVAPGWAEYEPNFIITEYPLGTSRMIDMATLFPSLETLRIPTLSVSDLPGLPPTLTLFEAELVRLHAGDFPNIILSVLPRTLRHLKCVVAAPKMIEETKDWAAAPPFLESIARIRVFDNDACKLMDCSWLPRSLTHVEEISSRYHSLGFDPSNYASLPSGLQALTCDISLGWLESKLVSTAQLPKHLTTLSVRNWGPKIASNDLRLLPSTLRSLYIGDYAVDWDSVKHDLTVQSRPVWPPNLTLLELFDDHPPSVLELLPRSLLSLNFKFDRSSPYYADPHQGCEEVFKMASSKFPPRLTNLSLAFNFNNPERQVCFEGPLPPGITHLKATQYDNKSAVTLHQTTIEFALPPALISLAAGVDIPKSFIGGSLSSNCFKNLKSLQTLRWEASWFSLLPTCLETLELGLLLGNAKDSHLQCISNLPSSLNKLRIEKIADCQSPQPNGTSHTCFAHLSRLRTLEIGIRFLWPSLLLRFLPKSLRRINIALESIELEDAQCIPPYLEIGRIYFKHLSSDLEQVKAVMPVSAPGIIEQLNSD